MVRGLEELIPQLLVATSPATNRLFNVFNFNEWSSPLLPGFLQGIVFAVLLTLRGVREERVSDYLAAILLLCGSLYIGQWMLGFAGWYDSHDWRTTFMFYVPWKHLLAFGPLIWLYFRSLTNTDFQWKRSYWWHFLPALLVLLEFLLLAAFDWVYWRGIAGNAFEDFHRTRGPASEWQNSADLFDVYRTVLSVLGFFLLGYYLLRTIKDYRNYRRYLSAEFSNTGQLAFRSFRITLYVMLAGVSLTFILEIVNQFFSKSYIDSWDSYFAMSVFTFAAAIQFLVLTPNLTRALRFEPEAVTEPTAALPEPSSFPARNIDPDLERWATRLEQRMASHNDYLNPDLKLGDLAEAVGTNSSVLSKVINGQYGKNFNDYINGLRCRAFDERIAAGEHHRHTLLSIALDCGFNSKSTFNRAYRKYAGVSPKESLAKS